LLQNFIKVLGFLRVLLISFIKIFEFKQSMAQQQNQYLNYATANGMGPVEMEC
jgi:hypothetical protein